MVTWCFEYTSWKGRQLMDFPLHRMHLSSTSRGLLMLSPDVDCSSGASITKLNHLLVINAKSTTKTKSSTQPFGSCSILCSPCCNCSVSVPYRLVWLQVQLSSILPSLPQPSFSSPIHPQYFVEKYDLSTPIMIIPWTLFYL